MKIKDFKTVAFVCFSIFIIYACSNDSLPIEEEEQIDAIAIKTKYCKYNVTKSSADGLSKGDIACTPCPANKECDDSKTAYPVQYPVGTVIGHFDGTLVNSDGECKNCPSDGFKTN